MRHVRSVAIVLSIAVIGAAPAAWAANSSSADDCVDASGLPTDQNRGRRRVGGLGSSVGWRGRAGTRHAPRGALLESTVRSAL